MPFKTRKQKQSAAERRYTFIEDKVVYAGSATVASPIKTAAVSGKRIIETINTRADLLKIVLTAVVIITVQLVLSLTLR